MTLRRLVGNLSSLRAPSRVVVAALLAAALVGCGGGSSSGSFNLYTGTWTGPWSAGTDVGTATLHFTGVNSVSGTIVDTTTSQTYNVSGSISRPDLNSTAIALSESNNGNLVAFSGTITLSASTVSKLNGTFTALDNSGNTQTITLSYSSSQ